MTKVLNGSVNPGDLITYSSRKRWGMYVRIGVIIRSNPKSLLVRVIKSSDDHELTRLVRVTKLNSVVKLKGGVT